jgi:hypothetical protein
LEKAFDIVLWKELFKTLEEIGIDEKQTVNIQYIQRDISYIKVSDKSATAKIGKRVK